jgi:chromosome segregation ATPase
MRPLPPERKRAEIARLRTHLKTQEDLLATLINARSAFNLEGSQLAAARAESSALLEFFGITSLSDLVPAFTAESDRLLRERDRRRSPISTLSEENAQLKSRLQQLRAISSSVSRVDAFRTDITDLRAFIHDSLESTRGDFARLLRALAPQIAEVHNRVASGRAAALESARASADRASAALDALRAERDDLRATIDALPPPPAGGPDPIDPAAAQKAAEQSARNHKVLKKSAALFAQAKQRLVPMEEALARIARKIAEIRRRRAAAAGAVADHADAARENLRVLLRIGRKAALAQRMFRAIAPALQEHAERVRESIEREQQDNRKIPGTDFTLRDLRREIVRLERAIFIVNSEAVRDVEATEAQLKRLDDDARRVHELMEQMGKP